MKNNFNKLKMISLLSFMFCICFIFSGCEAMSRQPLSVTFIDVSGALSTDHTINIKFSEEKDFDEKFIDILVKTDTDDVTLTLFQEFATDDNKIKLNINVSDGYISLDEFNLFNLEKEQTDSMVGYADVLSTNLVINSNKDAKLTFLAVIGEDNNGKFKKIGEVSKEYELKVKKKAEK